MSPRARSLAVLLGGLGLVALGAGVDAQAPPAPAPAAPAATPARPAPGGQARDPFEPLVRPVAPTEERKRQEIAGLKLVGIVWDVKNPDLIRALVETPDGLGYYLGVNDQKFGATVVAIQRDGVRFSVREEVPGGPTQTRTVELRLPKPEAQP